MYKLKIREEDLVSIKLLYKRQVFPSKFREKKQKKTNHYRVIQINGHWTIIFFLLIRPFVIVMLSIAKPHSSFIAHKLVYRDIKIIWLSRKRDLRK